MKLSLPLHYKKKRPNFKYHYNSPLPQGKRNLAIFKDFLKIFVIFCIFHAGFG